MLLLRHFKLIWFPHWQICCKGPRVVSRLVAHIFSGFKRSGEAWKCSVVGLSVHLADTSQPFLICLQGTGSEQGGKFGENIGHISKRRIRYLDFSGQLICFKRQFLRSQKFWDMCSVFHLLLDAHSGCKLWDVRQNIAMLWAVSSVQRGAVCLEQGELEGGRN